MDLRDTLILGSVFLALAIFCGWRGARPPNPHRGPRLVPWRFLMLLACGGELLVVIHLAALLGGEG